MWWFISGLIIGLIIMYYMNPKCDTLNTVLHVLTRQAARWTTAANQDSNPLIAVLHANYGTGYLWAIKDIATDNEVYNATGIDMKKFTREITNIQDKVTTKLAGLCKNYAPKENYLVNISREG
jgi:hypothetical protein